MTQPLYDDAYWLAFADGCRKGLRIAAGIARKHQGDHPLASENMEIYLAQNHWAKRIEQEILAELDNAK